ncbi:uncharacterized protein LOC131935604 isoform X1 [Physella acuta]|uniref:uncharacterized protein LOC131935604 isoform X1 n=2 Tax=Physella acuta TaxID=109671 RepID=UPI0027DB88FE|nr:uncharacterized protein LOC131935604 isoform X1 [Physella acuta]
MLMLVNLGMGICIAFKVLAALVFVAGVEPDCRYVDWSVSFKRLGLSECDRLGDMIDSLCRSPVGRYADLIDRLERVRCCSIPFPWQEGYDYVHENWWYSMETDSTWSLCRPGYFLTGLYRSVFKLYLSDLEEGRCTRPRNHPSKYGHCEDVDISDCFEQAKCCSCPEGSFIVGLYRGNCNDLGCLDKLRCCTLAESPH